MYEILEWIGVIANLAYLILLIRRSVYCWPAGIVGSGLSIYLFVHAQLYSEAILYIFYVLIAVYGWAKWFRVSDSQDRVVPLRWSFGRHLISVIAGTALSLSLGYYFDTYTDAERAYPDAFSTGFAFVASFLEARRVLSGWFYWIALNGFSIWLYADRELDLYSGLAIVYTVMSVYGYFSWKKALNESRSVHSGVIDEPGF